MKEATLQKGVRSRETFPLWNIVYWLVLGALVDVAFLLIKDSPLICDEGLHVDQISWFLKGNFHTTNGIPMLPVYHGMVAALFWLVGGKTLGQLRLVSFVVAIFSVWVFHVIVRRLWPAEAYLRTVQFVFLPVLFPFFFLIYTDAWSLLFVLLAVERLLAGKPIVSALFVGIAVLLRQTNIFWALFLWLLLIEQEQAFRRSFSQAITLVIHKTWPFLCMFALFGVCVLMHGIVENGETTHQYATLNLANAWFFLILFTPLFLPNTMEVLRAEFNDPSIAKRVVIVGLGCTAILFWLTYKISHQYNQPGLWFYLRNRLLYCTTHYAAIKLVAGIVALIGLLTLVKAPLAEPKLWTLPYMAIASVVFLPIIEQRYYIVPLSLFLAFRKAGSKSTEIGLTIFYMFAAAALFTGILRQWWFL